ncbi:MAG: shikimate kinase, partial [Verrucomicrobiota bacterium]
VDTTGQRTRNLILIGFMGTGKTTIGKQVAKSLGLEFVDTDALIARKAGKSIPDIFEEDGEKVFRRFETEVLRECVGKTDQVISTGGGIVTQPENSPLLEEGGYVVWLRAEAETIFERVRRNKHRPLLQVDDPLGTIRGLLEIRDPLYEQAQNLSIRTDELTMDETCYGVTETARLMLGLE